LRQGRYEEERREEVWLAKREVLREGESGVCFDEHRYRDVRMGSWRSGEFLVAGCVDIYQPVGDQWMGVLL
jgi:hypothetical protein